MDAGDFKTLGECDFGTVWEVQSENRIVVNAYQAALYFSKDHFLQFAKMVEDAVTQLTGKGFTNPATTPSPPIEEPIIEDSKSAETGQISDFLAFRKSKSEKPDGDDDDDGGDDIIG